MPIPSKSAFNLDKAKLLKEGGLSVNYEVIETAGSEVYQNRYNVEATKDPHPDLIRCFAELKPIMGRIFNITSFLSFMETPEVKATKPQIEKAREFAEKCLEKIEVKGVSFSGKDDNFAVIISGIYQVGNNQKVAINSPRIRTNDDVFGFEEELNNILNRIEEEVYAFLFENKQAQLSLFGEEGFEGEEDGDQ